MAAADSSSLETSVAISERHHCWLGQFRAMASPCEVHVADSSRARAERVIRAVADEAKRIEAKFSRYVEGNVIHRINTSNGQRVEVDDETARLLDYAQTLHALSDGRFDITSGVLRRAWTFDGGNAIPDRKRVRRLLSQVGWSRVVWDRPGLQLPAGMQIDLGGIGKEYAVDCAALIATELGTNCLINFGGDLRAQGPGRGAAGWIVGIESVDAGDGPARTIRLTAGALATSGDAYRYVLHKGKRYGHVLDPRTGWPVENAPRSVTVCTDTCTDAGALATLAMLHGTEAEAYLNAQEVRFWCLR